MKNKSPKVSIIIPVYNVEKYIERCVRSLFTQTLQDLEFIFIDDCTQDKSIEIISKLLQEFPERENQVVIHKMDENSGQAAVREWGMRHAHGDYVIHCDSDDWVDPNMYHIMYTKAIEEKAEIVICDYYISNSITNRRISINQDSKLMPQGPLWNKLVKRSLYSDFDFVYPSSNKAEDGAMVTQFVINANKLVYVHTPFYYYFCNDESICRNNSESNCMSKYNQEMDNLKLRLSVLQNNKLVDRYKTDVLLWQFAARENIYPLLEQKKYRQMWSSNFPLLNCKLLLRRGVSLGFKILVLKRILKYLFVSIKYR